MTIINPSFILLHTRGKLSVPSVSLPLHQVTIVNPSIIPPTPGDKNQPINYPPSPGNNNQSINYPPSPGDNNQSINYPPSSGDNHQSINYPPFTR
jgi:hypothetical protein